MAFSYSSPIPPSTGLLGAVTWRRRSRNERATAGHFLGSRSAERHAAATFLPNSEIACSLSPVRSKNWSRWDRGYGVHADLARRQLARHTRSERAHRPLGSVDRHVLQTLATTEVLRRSRRSTPHTGGVRSSRACWRASWRRADPRERVSPSHRDQLFRAHGTERAGDLVSFARTSRPPCRSAAFGKPEEWRRCRSSSLERRLLRTGSEYAVDGGIGVTEETP